MTIRELITPQWVKDRFLVGIDLTDDTGQPYPDALFEIGIDSAIEMVQDDLDIVFDSVAVSDEKHDTFGGVNGAPNFAPLRLRKRPVQAVTAIKARWGQNSEITVPSSWGNLDVEPSFSGSLTIIPTQDAISTLTSYGLPGFYRDVSPLWWRLSYTAGWADATLIPASLLMIIGWVASALPLDTAGDLIGGAGIASKSVSIDGLSTSVSTTSSATNAGYGARIISYQKQMATAMTAARNKYAIREVGYI